MKPQIKSKDVVRWIKQAQFQLACTTAQTQMLGYGRLTKREWIKVASRCRNARRLLDKALWWAETNAMRTDKV